MKKLLLILLLISVNVFSQNITFTFSNSQITGTSPKYFEFDIMVAASSAGTKIGAALAYVNYNTTAFGVNIDGNSKVSVNRGSFVSGPFYDLQVNDHATNRLSITINYLLPGSPTLGADLPTSATQWAHVSIEIANESATAGLSFQESLMEGQARQSDNVTIYTDVIATDTDNSSLPVQMSMMEAESTVEGIVLNWETASEVNSQGFHVWRADDTEGNYEQITTSLIASQGNSSSGALYSYIDKNFEGNVTYYYKIQQLDADGSSMMSEAIEVLALFIPTEFAMTQNYPNPFNPVTTFTYDVPEISDVLLKVYNLLGREVKTIYNEQQLPGRYTETWDGTDHTGQKLASGVYFLRMHAGDFTQMRKMTLLR
ncbi:FlgD immunoglobulin-like domain containing protein [bacterium]